MTAEHVFGDLLRKSGFNGEVIREIIPGDGAQPIIQKGGPFSKKLPIACLSCSTGWMSKLEEAAMPLLLAMFNAGGASVELDADAQLVLAQWAFKTAAVAAQVTGSDPFPAAHRTEFYNDVEPPKHVHLRIGTASMTNESHGLQLAGYRFEPRVATVSAAGQSVSFPCYRVTFRLINVVFDIVGYVTDDVEMQIEPDEALATELLPLWPPCEPRIWWPPTGSLDASGGLAGLDTAQLVGITTFLPTSES
ncbi:hypothetical protein [Kutzneria buriramensis]|uniref:Uncharacterized protein n=1 Tax=Kutzneria buriramensis TaxID=1045776 RepID=A0A3E0HMU4_9PSEU|nr:hypothetical protein [Kutzneria buriramensis]REH47325.1 hypothetical protein BCF44_106490 [Kutzneria buriramensis]